jgi:predicted Fe-Mo cluster-binding NifX family protein
MKVCFPVKNDQGLESHVYDHFGSAPVFLIADTETGIISPLPNSDQNHAHGRCSPVKALGGARLDAVIVGGIGAGALNGLHAQGIRVYQSRQGSVGQNLDHLRGGFLEPFDARSLCGGHGHGGSCHHQGHGHR